MSSLICRAARRFRSQVVANFGAQAGFSIIEIVVGALMITLIAGGVAAALIASNHLSADQRFHSQADQVAQQDQERLRGLSAQELGSVNNQSRTVQLDGTPYTVTSTAQFLNNSGGTSCGSSGNGAAAYYRIKSSVNWATNTRPPVVEESVISPPVGGVLLTQVQDQTGAGLAGVNVSARGPDSASGTTDSQGCVVLAGLVPGSYSLTLADSGYVDENGNPSPLSRTATLTGSGTATPSGGNPVRMAAPGAITAQFNSRWSGTQTFPNQQADAVSWFGNGASYGMSGPNSLVNVVGNLDTPTTQFTGGAMSRLFPFAYPGPSYTDNYAAWPGKCRQMEPPANTAGTSASVAPGSSSALTLPEPAIKLTATFNNAAVTPAHVKFSFTSTSGPSCSDSWYAPVVANTAGFGNLASPGQPFASTATSGASASASGYAGYYSICADYQSGSTLYKATTPSQITNANYASPTAVSVAITNQQQGAC